MRGPTNNLPPLSSVKSEQENVGQKKIGKEKDFNAPIDKEVPPRVLNVQQNAYCFSFFRPHFRRCLRFYVGIKVHIRPDIAINEQCRAAAVSFKVIELEYAPVSQSKTCSI